MQRTARVGMGRTRHHERGQAVEARVVLEDDTGPTLVGAVASRRMRRPSTERHLPRKLQRQMAREGT